MSGTLELTLWSLFAFPFSDEPDFNQSGSISPQKATPGGQSLHSGKVVLSFTMPGISHAFSLKCQSSPALSLIERFQSRDQQTCKFIGTKEAVYIGKELNSQRIGLVHQHGRLFIVWEHQYGCRVVM